jgi:proton-translocating NAD(P)+ transhydrogenase subunit alpha
MGEPACGGNDRLNAEAKRHDPKIVSFFANSVLLAVWLNVGRTRSRKNAMTHESLIASLYVFALAAFLGYQVISRVPPLLHTPLMSATNAISGISLVGSIVTAGAHYNTVSTILGFIAVVCSTTNVVGGFVITDRMLRMFKRKPK